MKPLSAVGLRKNSLMLLLLLMLQPKQAVEMMMHNRNQASKQAASINFHLISLSWWR